MEKRSSRRLNLDISVDLKKLDKFADASVNVDDFSAGGLFITTRENFQIGERFDMALSFPASEDSKGPTEVNVECEVMWSGEKLSEKERKVVSGIGVKFVNLTAETFEIILTLYERMQSGRQN